MASRVGRAEACHLLGRAGGDNPSAVGPAFRSEVDDRVGRTNDVEDVERGAGSAFGQLAGQLDALRLSPRECRRRLTEM